TARFLRKVTTPEVKAFKTMITYPGQSLPVAEPIAVYRDNRCVLLEDNELQQTANRGNLFSSFKIFKLKAYMHPLPYPNFHGPIDVNFLIDLIFPPEDRNCYEVETSEYDGESVRVRFKFFNKTHRDLIEYLKRASQNLSHISGNGLRDWVPADKITNQLVYGDSYNQLSSFTTDYSDDDNEYPEVDEEGLINELKNLAEQVKAQRKDIDDAKLNYLFYCAFEKSNTSLSLYDIKNEFFSQLNIVQFFPRSNNPFDLNDISDLRQAKEVIGVAILSHLQQFLNKEISKKITTDPRFCLAITLWNLINTMHTVHKSYQALKESDEKFRGILKEKKYIYLKYLNNMELWLVNMLKVLEEDLDETQYDKFQ
ncbi:7197_t:CDS:2, partial [Acaulospora morrowiae]